MLRLIIQTKRRYKKIVKRKDETNEKRDTDDLGSTGDESEDGQSSNTHNDQDSEISFEDDTHEEVDTTMIEEEEWIEYIKRSTHEAMEKVENTKIRCWNKTHKIMKWRLALRIASVPSERWLVKSCRMETRTQLKIQDQQSNWETRSKCEDDINEFLKFEVNATEKSEESDNKSWIKAAKDRGRWILLEKDFAMTAEERYESNARARRNTQSRPARYVNGLRLSDDDVANIT